MRRARSGQYRHSAARRAQEGRFFHEQYYTYRFHLPFPRVLRPASAAGPAAARIVAGSDGAIEEMTRPSARSARRGCGVRIILRGDSGFANDPLMGWCEENRVDYVFGLARNRRLEAALGNRPRPRLCLASGKPARETVTSAIARVTAGAATPRAVCAAEHTPDGANPRLSSPAQTRPHGRSPCPTRPIAPVARPRTALASSSNQLQIACPHHDGQPTAHVVPL